MKRLRNFMLAAAIAMGGGISPMTASALGQPPPGVRWEIMYYDSVSYSNLIGHIREYCDDHWSGWGGISEYSLQYSYDC